jgi:TPR repeat protein
MQRLPRYLQIAALAGFLLAAMPASADTAAGVAAFKNKDYHRAYQEWKAAAEAGRAEAEFDLGLLYAEGLGVRRDLSEAMRLYRSAAEKGNRRRNSRWVRFTCADGALRETKSTQFDGSRWQVRSKRQGRQRTGSQWKATESPEIPDKPCTGMIALREVVIRKPS